MGQQQLLLIILGVIIVGIAIAVGLSMFSAQSVQSNKDAIINDLNNLAANAYQFKIRPTSMGGGGGAYDASKGATAAYSVPSKMASNANGAYAATPTATTVKFVGTSTQYTAGTVTATLDSNGNLGGWTYGSDFQ
jgi:hypothetical protein